LRRALVVDDEGAVAQSLVRRATRRFVDDGDVEGRGLGRDGRFLLAHEDPWSCSWRPIRDGRLPES
ncbi:MAG: hypothetical protein KDB53_16610, partial [Planctomycetes bacterium]|nr:hypothetical protein [Planctomycetota bacterium]